MFHGINVYLIFKGCGMPIGYSAVILPQLVDNPDQKLTVIITLNKVVSIDE